MITRIVSGIAATAVVLGLGVAGAASASASPSDIRTTPVAGSASICFFVPVGSASVGFCI